MRIPVRLVACAILLCAVTAPLAAHHSFAMYDRQAETWIEGTVTDFQWANPHTFIQLAVKGKGGATTEWSLEGGSPNILSRNGWNRLSLKPGDQVKVLLYPLKSGQPGGSFLEVHKADGAVLYYHG